MSSGGLECGLQLVHLVDAAALATWAQRSEDVPSVGPGRHISPGPDGYRAATVHYLGSSG